MGGLYRSLEVVSVHLIDGLDVPLGLGERFWCVRESVYCSQDRCPLLSVVVRCVAAL